jgi:hypothetical protein
VTGNRALVAEPVERHQRPDRKSVSSIPGCLPPTLMGNRDQIHVADRVAFTATERANQQQAAITLRQRLDALHGLLQL